MDYDSWEEKIPKTIKADSLWQMQAYRLSLFLADIGWYDVTKLAQDRRMIKVSNQLYGALGSIGANLAEGYSRGTGKDRARFYEYALGSARESRNWYFDGRHVLGEKIAEHRFRFLARIIRLLLTMIPQQRGRTLREENQSYNVETDEFSAIGNEIDDDIDLNDLLQNIPLPEL
jgi:four helix bundle protein